MHMRCPLVPVILLLAVFTFPAFARGEEYRCPFLKDQKHQTLYKMSQGEDGWFFRNSTDFKENFSLSDETSRYLARLVRAFKARGTALVMIPLPVRGMVERDALSDREAAQKNFDPERAQETFTRYIQDLRKTGTYAVDLTDSEESLNPEYFFKRDIHWTPEGARVTAEKAGAFVKATPEYRNVTPVRYETKNIGTKDMKGKIFLELLRLCSSKIPAENIPVYETRLQATGADALFGTSDDPSVLIGTSFSEMEILNFEGFLSQSTGLTIANYAIAAGELFKAMLSYVSSPNFADGHPPFLFWETPGHYNINLDSAKFFRQIIPAIEGECSAKEAVASGQFDVVDGKGGELLRIPNAADVSGSDYYLFITTNNIGFVKFSLEMEYSDGDGEWFTVDQSSNYKNHGRYFVELWDDISSSLTSVRLQDTDKQNAKLDIRLCKARRPDKVSPQL